MSDNKSVDLAPLTDDEQASNTSWNSTVPAQHLRNRYNFVYPVFPPGSKVPRFKDHPFWNALSSSDGRALAKLAVVVRRPKFDFNRETALAILAAGLPSFRLMVSTLDPRSPVPADITQFFPFPASESIPVCAPGFSPLRATTAAGGPTRDQLNNAPHLSKPAPRPRTPSEVANSPPPAVSPPLKPATAKKRKSKPQQAKSASIVPSDESREDEPLSKRCKTAGKGNHALSESPGLNDGSALCRSKRSEVNAPKSPSGKVPAAVQAKVDAMIPIIRTKLAEMLVERTKSRFCFIRHEETHYTLTLSAFQGHQTYVPNNTFGPAPPPKKKGEFPKEPLVELVRFSAIECKQVLQPPGACLLCLMYSITCNPTAFGLACTHCNQKKLHTLCDHTWRADTVREVMGGIEELRGIMFPEAPIVSNMLPHLIEQVSSACNLYSSLRNDLTSALCTFFSSVRNYVAVSGEEVFCQEFKSTLPHVTARGQINSLIHAFNHYHDPKTAHLPLKPYKFADDEKDDTGPSKSSGKKVVLTVKEPEADGKEDGEVDEDTEGEVDTTFEWKPESSKLSPRKKRKRTPSE
ncbi:hypothetical protein B0H14DRAFT_3478891 [Mycena olivaceomarginata]|nr:hypothetical protein B0H14DRAFT_3478891 [Mycena olivaceomarginata]